MKRGSGKEIARENEDGSIGKEEGTTRGSEKEDDKRGINEGGH